MMGKTLGGGRGKSSSGKLQEAARAAGSLQLTRGIKCVYGAAVSFESSVECPWINSGSLGGSLAVFAVHQTALYIPVECQKEYLVAPARARQFPCVTPWLV